MSRLARIPAPWIVVGAVLVALAANLAIFAVGTAAGGTFRFTSPTGPATVDALTVAGFTVVPLGVALTIAALVGRFWRPALMIALIVGPILELGSIIVMTLPTDFDTVSKIALASCHVVLVPVTVVALLALRRRYAERLILS